MGTTILKKASMALMALVLSFGLMVPAAFADSPTVTKVTEKSGDDGQIVVTVLDGDPADQAGTGAQITSPSGTPLGGVSINAVKIGSVVELTTTDANNKVSTQVAYGLSSDIADVLGLENGEAIANDGDTYYFEPTVVQNALSNADQDSIEQYVGTATGKVGQTTDSNGKVTFSQLNYGLYLLAKSDLPANATTDLVPFLVSVPMYVESDSGNAWQSTVYAYPKVRSADITVAKTAGGDDKYVTSSETIPYTITAKIGAAKAGGTPRSFNSFVITDTNSRQTLDIDFKSLEVMLDKTKLTGIEKSQYEASGNEGQYDFYYTYESVSNQQGGDSGSTEEFNSDVLTITMTSSGLQRINSSLNNGETITVSYNATVDQTVDFQSEISNNATVTFQRKGTNNPTAVNSNSVSLYTYGIDLTKTLSDTADKIAAGEITFKLSKTDNGATPTDINVNGGNGTYWQGGIDSSTMSVAENGNVILYGLDSGTYSLEELTTKQGYTLLGEPITIVISDENGDGIAEATVNGVSADVNNGVVSLSVENVKTPGGFTLPKTGGLGTLIMTAIGLGLLCVAIVLLTTCRKKNKKNA